MNRLDPSSDNRIAKNGASRKRIRLVTVLVLSLTVWAGATAWGQTGKFKEKFGRLDALEAKLEESRKVNDSLKREIERLNDPEYREEKARKDLHLAKPGETVFDVPRANP